MRRYIINLFEDFKPLNGVEIKVNKFIFSGGEPHVKIQEFGYSSEIDNKLTITTRINNMNDFIILSLLKDAVDRNYSFDWVEVIIPYFPGARQDRVCNSGEPLTVKVFANMINSMNFNRVTIFDPHSDVTPAVIKNCKLGDYQTFIHNIITNNLKEDNLLKNYLLIAPDAGSEKKVNKLGRYLNLDVIHCSKNRDTKTGKILDFSVNNVLRFDKETCYIVDDICDGGGTFIGLAKKLKQMGAGKIILIVSHGIFSKGFKELRKNIDKIYCSDSIASSYPVCPEDEKGSEIVEVIELDKYTL